MFFFGTKCFWYSLSFFAQVVKLRMTCITNNVLLCFDPRRTFPNVRKHLRKIEREIASEICGFWIDGIIHYKRKIIHNMVRITITIIADTQIILT